MNRKHKKFMIALTHDSFNVRQETTVFNEQVTLITFPTALQAWMQLRPIFEELEEIVSEEA